jgi:hypothetical protein
MAKVPRFCEKCNDAGYQSLYDHLKEFLAIENRKFKASKYSTETMVGKASVLDALEEFLRTH